MPPQGYRDEPVPKGVTNVLVAVRRAPGSATPSGRMRAALRYQKPMRSPGDWLEVVFLCGSSLWRGLEAFHSAPDPPQAAVGHSGVAALQARSIPIVPSQ